MNYYKITFKNIPEILFAHKYETKCYDMSFKKTSENRIELTYIDTGTLYFSNGQTMHEGTLNTAVYSKDVHGVSRGAHHRHYTVCISCEKCERISPEKLFHDIKAEYSSSNLFFAARECTFLPKTSLKAKELILDIIQVQLAERYKTAVYSKLLELFTLVTDDTLSSLLRETASHAHSDYLYCTKAREYISEHIYEKIYIEDIANKLSLSRGHLSRIFKDVTSHTIVDYINRTKIDAACEILDTVGGTAAELSSLLSVSDEKYLCRLFKKYKGMNIKEYKKMNSKTV